jgi:hypothetical protein
LFQLPETWEKNQKFIQVQVNSHMTSNRNKIFTLLKQLVALFVHSSSNGYRSFDEQEAFVTALGMTLTAIARESDLRKVF